MIYDIAYNKMDSPTETIKLIFAKKNEFIIDVHTINKIPLLKQFYDNEQFTKINLDIDISNTTMFNVVRIIGG